MHTIMVTNDNVIIVPFSITYIALYTSMYIILGAKDNVINVTIPQLYILLCILTSVIFLVLTIHVINVPIPQIYITINI